MTNATELKRWKAERQAYHERSDLVVSYKRPVVAVRAIHLPGAPIVRTLSHMDIDEIVGKIKLPSNSR